MRLYFWIRALLSAQWALPDLWEPFESTLSRLESLDAADLWNIAA
jgi:hypothetical protein